MGYALFAIKLIVNWFKTGFSWRLAAALLGHGKELTVTHQELADELGTVREIVSRLLRRFEREGWLVLAREHIHIRDSAALRTVAAALT